MINQETAAPAEFGSNSYPISFVSDGDSVADLNTEFDVVYIPLGAAAFGGAERSLLELASAQQSAGRRVLVCYEAALARGDFITQARSMKLPLHPLTWAPEAKFVDVIASAWRLFRRLKMRIVHFNISWRRQMWLVPLTARLFSKAHLLGTMRAMPERFTPGPRSWYGGVIPSLRLWVLIDRARDLWCGHVWACTLHRTVSVNRNDYPPRLVSEFGFPPSRLGVIYNGVRITPTEVTAEQRVAAKQALGYTVDTFLVAYVGRLSSEKGVQHAIEALHDCDGRICLLVAGEGPERDNLLALAQRIGVGTRVRFLGYVSDPFAIFSAVDAAVTPSLCNEAFGRVVVEAMACGAAVVATAVGGMQEIFQDGVGGLLVPRADSAAIAAALNRLAADPEYLRSMASTARKLAVERYSTERVAAEYGRLYAAALHERSV